MSSICAVDQEAGHFLSAEVRKLVAPCGAILVALHRPDKNVGGVACGCEVHDRCSRIMLPAPASVKRFCALSLHQSFEHYQKLYCDARSTQLGARQRF